VSVCPARRWLMSAEADDADEFARTRLDSLRRFAYLV